MLNRTILLCQFADPLDDPSPEHPAPVNRECMVGDGSSVCPPSIDRSNNLRIEITNWRAIVRNNRLNPLVKTPFSSSDPTSFAPLSNHQPTKKRSSTRSTVCGISSTDFNCEFEDLISTRNFYNHHLARSTSWWKFESKPRVAELAILCAMSAR